ncbi:MAG: type II secretion system protein [Xanthomonadales bacterium]|nr:type II secretion system protein [Xanthomonadales bacterium]
MSPTIDSSSLHTGRRRGFTLIELIVAIMIAAILITLAVPGFTSTLNSGRVMARPTSCSRRCSWRGWSPFVGASEP